ncbi:SigB/SigF/SigG family RNA polymerase sigma factor [Glycomyces scopariae]
MASEHDARTEQSVHRPARARDEYGELRPLFERLAAMPESDPDRQTVRDRLICGHLPLAGHIAYRYSRKGIATDDLVQVATVGLIHAVDRFDPAFGKEFLAYAVPTIMGEVRRHFRDTAWPMRVPRRLQELRIAINNATADLAQTLGHPVTGAELAEYLDVSEAEVAEGLEARRAFRSVSLDEPAHTGTGAGALAETLGAEDLALGLVDDIEALAPLLQQLP